MPGILRVDQANVDYIYAKTAGRNAYIPGHVIQVQQVTYNDVISASGSTFTDIPNLTTSITPTSSSSKILVIPSFCVGSNYASYQIMFRAYRVISGSET